MTIRWGGRPLTGAFIASARRLLDTADVPGFDRSAYAATIDDAIQLLESGTVDLCPYCLEVMVIGDEFPEERCCEKCAGVGR